MVLTLGPPRGYACEPTGAAQETLPRPLFPRNKSTMATPSPLIPLHEEADAAIIPFGPTVSIVGAFETTELEYAAIRKAAGIQDAAQRGLIELTGKDRLDFLHRMLSNDCRSLTPGQGRRALMLNSKGRIIADMVVLQGEKWTLLDLEASCAQQVAADLEKFLFSEDVKIRNVTQGYHRLSLHGPRSAELLALLAGEPIAQPLTELYQHVEATLGGGPIVLYREDQTAEPGLHLWLDAEKAADIYTRLVEAGKPLGARRLGWLAYNVARIEAGWPLFMVDYATDSLPHETGVLDRAVSFTKGCYTGQEIVARMQSLGHPSKILVGFKTEGQGLPVAGAAIQESEDPESKVIGAVTSSTFAPMLSGAHVGFAVVKWAKHDPGTKLCVLTDAGRQPLEVCPLPFYEKRS